MTSKDILKNPLRGMSDAELTRVLKDRKECIVCHEAIGADGVIKQVEQNRLHFCSHDCGQEYEYTQLERLGFYDIPADDHRVPQESRSIFSLRSRDVDMPAHEMMDDLALDDGVEVDALEELPSDSQWW